MIRCQACETQNSESAEVCKQCGAGLNVSPTLSISSEPAIRGDSSQPANAGRGFTPGSVIADATPKFRCERCLWPNSEFFNDRTTYGN